MCCDTQEMPRTLLTSKSPSCDSNFNIKSIHMDAFFVVLVYCASASRGVNLLTLLIFLSPASSSLPLLLEAGFFGPSVGLQEEAWREERSVVWGDLNLH